MNKNAYLKSILKDFPQIVPSEVKLIKRWWNNDIVIINNSLVFRFPKDENTKQNLIHESNLLDTIHGKTWLKTPYYVYKNKNLEYAWYKIIEWRELKKSDINTKENTFALAKQIGWFLSKLHAIPVSNFVWFESNIEEHYTLKLGYHKYIAERYLQIEKLIDGKLFKRSLAFIEKIYPLTAKCVSMTHFDFQPKNIIFDPFKNEISWVIDFTDSAIYDPAIDFIHLLSFSERFTEQVLGYYTNDFWDLFQRAQLLQIKNFVFTFPDLIEKYPWKKNMFEKRLEKSLDTYQSDLLL